MGSSKFTSETWLGHWADDSGFWIVIEHAPDFDIVRSGDNMPPMTDIYLSRDFRSLTFTEGNQWRHELTLKNKYEATHVWHDLTNNRVWKKDVLHKLRRATPKQRAFTRENE